LDVTTDPLDDDAVVLHRPGSGEAHVLNATAALVWEHCNGRRTADDIASVLVDRYGVDPSRARADVLACLARLAELGVLAYDAGPSPR
jgi:PqqD family protein of HPr-rel-A system